MGDSGLTTSKGRLVEMESLLCCGQEQILSQQLLTQVVWQLRNGNVIRLSVLQYLLLDGWSLISVKQSTLPSLVWRIYLSTTQDSKKCCGEGKVNKSRILQGLCEEDAESVEKKTSLGTLHRVLW